MDNFGAELFVGIRFLAIRLFKKFPPFIEPESSLPWPQNVTQSMLKLSLQMSGP